MLVLANGASKSGSTWLQAILREMGDFNEIPTAYRSSRHQQAWLDRSKVRAFLESGSHLDRNFLSKGHFGEPKYRDIFLSYPGVKVVGIERDMRDTIVSHYYHFLRERRVGWSFHNYYWRIGRFKAFQLRQYHRTWGATGGNVYVSSFERLKNDFHEEVARIAAFLGRDLSKSDIERIKEDTSLERLRRRYGQDRLAEDKRFFRRGAVGDWRLHFDEAKLADIRGIEQDGLGRLGLGLYYLLFSLRPAVGRVVDSGKSLVKGPR